MTESSDLRQFMREILRRHERVWGEQARELKRQGERLERGTEALVTLIDEIRDGRDEQRAQTRALMHILDKLENGGAQA